MVRKRVVGWTLSAMLLLLWASPQAALLRELPERLTMAQGQRAALPSGFPLAVNVENENVAALSSEDETLTLRAQAAGESRATISLLGMIPLRDVRIDVSDELVVYPGGQAIGVAMHTQGVLVVGTSDLSGENGASPARLAGLRAGDLITRIDGVTVEDTSHLTQLVAAAGGKSIPLTVRRGEAELNVTLQPKLDAGGFRIGAWVRDSTAGVGTLSFYTTGASGNGVRFGALGHAITDGDTQQILTVGRGQVLKASIVDVQKGQRGIPGELKGSFLRENEVIGSIAQNNVFGVYGMLDAPPAHPLYPNGLPIGRKDAVHTGAASILCTVEGEQMTEYAVELTEVARQNEAAPRSMIVKVTDERLLQKTGGIVQGMSGSPILQDGRLIGAVTHVYVNDPTQGYGLYIEWMLGQLPEV